MRLSQALSADADSPDMNSIAARKADPGFALAETLVALLLLAVAMGAAGAALVESLAGQRTALLQTQAADLAANLAEALRSAPDAAAAAAEIHAWHAATLALLPQAESLAIARAQVPPASGVSLLPVRFDISLQWQVRPERAPSRFTLPLAFNAAAGTP